MQRTILLRLAVVLLVSGAAVCQCEIQKLTASSPETGSYGISVALSDEFAVVGDPDDDSQFGSAYVYVSTSSGWVELTALESEPLDFALYFGYSVAISKGTILVSAPDGVFVGGGAVYVFEYDGVVWNRTAKLTASDSVDGLAFGSDVALDGDRALVGALGSAGGTGAAYVFERSGSTWTERTKLTASDGEALDLFGISASLSGNLALVGSLTADGGAAYVYDRAAGWAEVAKLVPSDPEPDDSFGGDVAIHGNTAAIGDRGDDTRAKSAGAAYVFERDMSTWTQVAKLLGGDGAAVDHFGTSVAIQADKVVVGTDGDVPGSAYVFRKHLSGWTYEGKLVAGDGARSDGFGQSAAIAGDSILVGALYASGPFGNHGAAYIFQMPSFATAYCFGVACPCGNDDPVYGCANSSLGLDGIPQSLSKNRLLR